MSSNRAVRAVASRWCSTPSIATTYTALRHGGTPEDRRRLAEPVAPGLVLAGEATSVDHPGTMHGAWASGERAADRLLGAGATGVVVVGAGLAGLAAARRVRDRGGSVVVVEADTVLGGRARVDHAIGVPVHPGAAWVHGEVGNPVAESAARLGVPLHPSTGERRLVVPGRGLLGPSDVARLEVWRIDVERRLDALAAAGPDRPLGPVVTDVLAELPLEPWEREALGCLVRSSYENVTAAPIDDLSLRWRSEPYHLPGDDHLVGADLGRIVDDLAVGLDVRLGVTATAIRAGATPGRWTVATTAGDLPAEAVVVTTPIGALLAGRPSFEPPLPAVTLGALGRLTPGIVVKVTATFPEAFWAPARSIHVLGRDADHIPAWVDVSVVSGRPTLAGFATGPEALALEAADEPALRALVDRCLAPAVVELAG
ncbi:MAG: FAD-binding protein [Actinobacteria bacterium]|nr:FAD-binding protein [Actinomycetota bacterium]